MPNDFSIRYSGINFHSWQELSYSLLIQKDWRAIILFGISTFFNPPALESLHRVLCFILGEELFKKKAICIFFLSSLTICFGTVVINAWKTNFDIAIVLKITIFPSGVSFLIFHIFKTNSLNMLHCYKNLSPLSIFRCKRNGYLIFLTCRNSDLYKHTRLPLELLSGLQYPQFQILLNLVLILKSTKKNKKKHQPYVLQK